MHIRKIHLAFCLCLLLTGCDTYTAAPYSISMDNEMVLKRLPPANATVEAFTAPNDPSMQCRLVGPIHLPGDVAPQDYIAKALADELELANLSGGSGPGVILTGQIDKFGFSSMMGDASWQLGVTVASSNGKKMSVQSEYDFHASFAGEAACHNVADAFEPAVQALVAKIISDPEFAALLKK